MAGDVQLRLSIRDADTVKRALTDLGRDGEKALRLIEREAKGASGGLKAVDNAAKDVRSRFDDFLGRAGPVGRFLRDLGPAGMAGGAAIAGLTIMTTLLAGLALKTAAYADALKDQSAAAGLNVEVFQEWTYVFERHGVARDQAIAGLRDFNARLGQIRTGGGGEAKAAYEALQIAITDAGGAARATEDVLEDAIRQLARLDDAALRSALAGQMFGEEFGRKMAAALDAGMTEIDAYRLAAHEMGLLTEEEVERGNELSDTLRDLQDRWSALGMAVGSDIIPVLQTLTGLFQWLNDNSRDPGPVAKWLLFAANAARGDFANAFAVSRTRVWREGEIRPDDALRMALEPTDQQQEDGGKDSAYTDDVAARLLALRDSRASGASDREAARLAAEEQRRMQESLQVRMELAAATDDWAERERVAAAMIAMRREELERLDLTQEQVDRTLDRYHDQLMGVTTLEDRARAIMEASIPPADKLRREIEALQRAKERATGDTANLTAAIAELEQQINAATPAGARLKSELDALITAREDALVAQERMDAAIAGGRAALESGDAAMMEAARIRIALAQAAESAATQEERLAALRERLAENTNLTEQERVDYLELQRQKMDEINAANEFFLQLQRSQIQSWGDVGRVALNALHQIVVRMIQAVILGQSLGAALGFGGRAASGAVPPALPAPALAAGPILHGGGRVGQRRPGEMDWGNGRPLRDDERWVLAQRDEHVLSPADSSALEMLTRILTTASARPAAAGGGELTVRLIDNTSGAVRMEQGEERRTAGGGRQVDVMLFDKMDDYFNSGRGDRAVGRNFGMRRRPA